MRPNLEQLVPRTYLEHDPDGTIAALLAAVQDQVDKYAEEIGGLARLYDVETLPEDFLDGLLGGLGNPFAPPGSLTVGQKRALALALVGMYQTKGTKPGIVAALAHFGFVVSIEEHWPESWLVGISEVGFDNVVAPDPETEQLHAFTVHLPETVEDLELVRRIVRYMAPPECCFYLVRGMGADWDEGASVWDEGLSTWDPEFV